MTDNAGIERDRGAAAIQPTQAMFDLYDQYCHSQIDRRTFMERLGGLAAGGVTAAMLAEALLPKYASALQLREDDPGIVGARITYDSPEGAGKQGKQMGGYLVRPAKPKAAKLPAIVVVHENRGLNPHIADVARRAAASGFLAFAPDALYPLGGYPGTDDEGRTLQSKRNGAEMLEDFIAAVKLMQAHPDCTGKVGMVGFCFGGGICNNVAVRVPTLGASAPYYGAAAALDDVPKINAPLLITLAGLDERVNAGYPAYEDALKKAGKTYTLHTYAGCQHGFHNDTTPRFDPENARVAWARTLDFFRKHLA
jgi:carboxymethylenebutenolidase